MRTAPRTRRIPHRLVPGIATGPLADYERFRLEYERLRREEPENLVGITLVGMDLARARKALMGF